ncbi:MAG: energy transducer TonB [Sulfurimonas sp.]|uniref:energy transducer TonB n=1 Tax=Sulfurimonas sp. TaxID=2022749 RepID=UPI0025E0580C|nr:energy transducer TonB [Sulfurimonas sp.]MCK9491944.1 energy transducer TonB [Sulfurimonas sp.]
MYLSLKEKKSPKEHKFLLLLSVFLVLSTLSTLFQANKYITISSEVVQKEKKRILALVINPAPIKKEIIKEKVIEKPKKKPKPIKKEILKKEVIKDKVVKEVVEKEIVQTEVETKQEIVQKVEQVEKPIFDEKAKESFIAGLYEMLNENKHYPKMAKRRKLEGVCEVSFTLSKDGRLKDIFLKEACGHSILDKAALKVVRSVEFYKPIPDSVSLSSLHLNIPIKYARN